MRHIDLRTDRPFHAPSNPRLGLLTLLGVTLLIAALAAPPVVLAEKSPREIWTIGRASGPAITTRSSTAWRLSPETMYGRLGIA